MICPECEVECPNNPNFSSCFKCFSTNPHKVNEEWAIVFINPTDRWITVYWNFSSIAPRAVLVNMQELYQKGRWPNTWPPKCNLFYIFLHYQKSYYTPWKRYEKKALGIINNPGFKRQIIAMKMK